MLYFLLGLFLGAFGYPILEGITSVILTWFELKKGGMSLDIAKYNAKMQQISDSEEASDTQAIGFVIPSDEDDENEDI